MAAGGRKPAERREGLQQVLQPRLTSFEITRGDIRMDLIVELV